MFNFHRFVANTLCLRAATALMIVASMTAAAPFARAADESHGEGDHDESRFSDKPIPLLKTEDVLRPAPLIEIGNKFLGAGNVDPGFNLPTGANWQPSFYAFGTYRSAIQTFRVGDEARSEWANRLDIFGNLQLSGTERVLIGFRPLNNEDGEFTGYNIEGDPEGWEANTSGRISTFFFEGNFEEIFPDLQDPTGVRDLGFSVGRQALFFQDGMLINDELDAVGLTKNNIPIPGGSNLRTTFIFGWNEISRDNGRETGSDPQLYGLFNQADLPFATINGDFVYVHDPSNSSDSAHWAVSSTSRIGLTNATFRYLGSEALEDESAFASSGHLLFAQLSWTPHHTHDIMYVNGFVGIDEFSSAARSPLVGGPLGNTGILFAAVGLGRYGAALGNTADNSYGAAIGYQLFIDPDNRQQIIFEVGGRASTEIDASSFAAGARYQQAMGQHWVLQLDIFGVATEHEDPGMGGRVEIRYEF